jgi:nitrile hydratase accessory protein
LHLPELPRDANGPVFAEPWQAQAFALTLQLHAKGAFTWPEWAAALSERLAAAGAGDDPARYYERWLEALEMLVTDGGLVSPHALATRRRAWEHAYENTPHGTPVELTNDSSGNLG